MTELFGLDCYSPKEIAERVENVGVTKANLPLVPMTALGVLAGGFIGLGALFFTLVVSDTMSALNLADELNTLFCTWGEKPVAVPLIGRSTRDLHLQRL